MRIPLVIAAVLMVIAVAVVLISDHNDQRADDNGYLYAVYTDASGNLDVIDVYESHVVNGVPTAMTQRYRDPVNGINPLWKFDDRTGIGPFNSFYAAVNILDGSAYHADDSVEKRKNTDAGTIAYILDPNDLSRTLARNAYTCDLYNVMLIVPTVYWTSAKVTADSSMGNLKEGTEYNVLYLSSSSSYTPSNHAEVSGMIAYAHSASRVSGITDFNSFVYPYLGIGVYESYATVVGDKVGPGLLISQSNRIPASDLTVDAFKDLADSLVPVQGSKVDSFYQQWNYYQWTLYKMMCYTVMGSKNSQVMVGTGYTEGNTCKAVTGSTDRVGMYGNASETTAADGTVSSEKGRTAAKLFIENSWGSLNEFIGDTFVGGDVHSDQRLYAGNYLGGEKLLDHRVQPSASQMWADTIAADKHRVIAATSSSSATWDTPILSDANRDAYTDPAFPGDIVNSKDSGPCSLTAGGRWDNKHYSGVAFICAGYDIALANMYRGARLACLMSGDVI